MVGMHNVFLSLPWKRYMQLVATKQVHSWFLWKRWPYYEKENLPTSAFDFSKHHGCGRRNRIANCTFLKFIRYFERKANPIKSMPINIFKRGLQSIRHLRIQISLPFFWKHQEALLCFFLCYCTFKSDFFGWPKKRKREKVDRFFCMRDHLSTLLQYCFYTI